MNWKVNGTLNSTTPEISITSFVVPVNRIGPVELSAPWPDIGSDCEAIHLYIQPRNLPTNMSLSLIANDGVPLMTITPAVAFVLVPTCRAAGADAKTFPGVDHILRNVGPRFSKHGMPSRAQLLIFIIVSIGKHEPQARLIRCQMGSRLKD